VLHFLNAVNASGGTYRHRWGDAPIQTAALRLHGKSDLVLQLDVDYLLMSTRNKIVGGEEVPFGTLTFDPSERLHVLPVVGDGATSRTLQLSQIDRTRRQL
jgi:hypothetical protein